MLAKVKSALKHLQGILADFVLRPGSAGRRNALQAEFPAYASAIGRLSPSSLKALDDWRALPPENRTELGKVVFSLGGTKVIPDILTAWASIFGPKSQEKMFLGTWKALASGDQPRVTKRALLELMTLVPDPDLALEALTVTVEKLPEGHQKKAILKGWGLIDPEEQVKLRTRLRNIVPMDYPKAKIEIVCDSLVELRTRAHSASKEPELVEWIENEFREGDVFYDIGANIGAYSLIAAARYGEKIRVFAFEPSYPSFSQLVTNIFLNHFESIITPLPIALGNAKPSLGSFVLSNLDQGRSFNYLQEFVEKGFPTDKINPEDTRRQSVLLHALDNVIDTYHLPFPTHCKIDIDGFELPLLQGASKTLSDPRLRSLHIELNRGDQSFAEITRHFEQFGFRVHRSSDRGDGTTVNLFLGRETTGTPTDNIYNSPTLHQ